MSAAARMLPASHHRLLLEAALSIDPERARGARETWTAQVDLDKLDFGSLQLLPLLAARDEPIPDEELARQVHHVVRFTWLRSQLLGRRVAPVVAALDEAGLQPMLSKGAALVNAHRMPQKLRPMFDVDIAVPVAGLVQANNVLAGLGFSSEIGRGIELLPERMACDTHAASYTDDEGTNIDLHWHLLHTARNDELDARFRARSVECKLAGVECRATGLEDSLVVTISHGTRWARTTAVRWVGDVGLILRDSHEEIDWDQLVRSAREVRVSSQVADGLSYAGGLVGIELPSSVLHSLKRAPVPVAVRLRDRRPDDPADDGPRPAGRVGGLAEAYEEDVACTVPPGAETGPSDFARFLARRWGLGSARQVPAHALWVAAGRPWWPRSMVRPRLTADMRAWLEGWPYYEFGTELRFDDTGDGYQRLGPGWWYPEPHGTWTRTHCARIVLPLAAHPPYPLIELELELAASIAPKRPEQRVTIVFGNKPVATVTLDERVPGQKIHALVPASQLTKEMVAVVSIISDPVMTPADSRLNSDLRQIGVGLRSLRLFS